MLVINPDECIDCGVCEPECPAEAILPDTHPEAEKWLDLNRRFSEVWPNISEQVDPLADADEYNPVKGYDADKTSFFDPNPG